MSADSVDPLDIHRGNRASIARVVKVLSINGCLYVCIRRFHYMVQRTPDCLAASSILCLQGDQSELVPMSAVMNVVTVLVHACTLLDQSPPHFVPIAPPGLVYDSCVPSVNVLVGALPHARAAANHGRYRSIEHVQANSLFILNNFMRCRSNFD
jgi:hypothetical protein